MKDHEQRITEGILYTDQYQLTMAQLYFRQGLHERRAQFDHFFRSYPDYGEHQAGYCVNAGLAWLLDWLERVRFTDETIDLLRSQKGLTGRPTFHNDFLDWLRGRDLLEGLTMRAVPEGRVVHPNEPLTVVEGPLALAQILESPLLNHLNYPTLIATKAARLKDSASGGMVLDFGLRRAQGSGANAGIRGALIGGADFSSAVGVSHVLGYEPKGTQAHSMIQAYMALGEGELGAFRAYAEIYPDDCLLLADTVDTLESGIPNAITVFEELRAKGHRPVGIRLDSGDLAYLAIQTARMLNGAGFPDVSIVLSNQLDEFVIWQIVSQIQREAPHYGVDPDNLIGRLVYGVGTNLITSGGDSALDGVYKLVSIEQDGSWTPAVKVSESLEKVTNPGDKRVWRIYDREGKAIGDLLALAQERPDSASTLTLYDPARPDSYRTVAAEEVSRAEPLLETVVEDGEVPHERPSIETLRGRREEDVERLFPGVRRFINPHTYHVSLSAELSKLKWDLVESARGGNRQGPG